MGYQLNLQKSRLFLALLVFVFFQACGNIVVSDDCPCGFYTIAGTDRKLHWQDGAEIPFRFEKDFPDVYRLAVEESVRTYNEIFAKTKIVIRQKRNDAGSLLSKEDAAPMNSDPSSVTGDGENGIYWIKGEWPWAKSDPDSAAMTVLQFSQHGIIEADVFFREEDYGPSGLSREQALDLFSLEEGFQIERTDRDTKMVYVLGVHEFGHVMGRTHNELKGSVMNSSVGVTHATTPLSDEDLQVLGSVYSLKSPSTSSKSTGLYIP